MAPKHRCPFPRGVVVTYAGDGDEFASEHERITQAEVARRLAALKGYEVGGEYEPARRHAEHVYFVPSCTLVTPKAAELGIRRPDDLFGGVVPHAFVATKAISHPLVGPDCAALPGWNREFAERVGDAVLGGYTVFSRQDASRAGRRLLASSPVRIKPVRATAGRGQSVARDPAELERRLDAMDENEISSHGLVLEEHLTEVRTFSVGQVTVDGLAATYFGLQRLTRNNAGHEVYGGSNLVVARGDYDALRAFGDTSEMRLALEQARRYDAAVGSCFPGFFASRRNYDVVMGVDAAGRPRSGVLEQSWRVGGATGAELAALELFAKRPGCMRVRAAAVEVFGASPAPPPEATVYFRGIDPKTGALTKFSLAQADVDAR